MKSFFRSYIQAFEKFAQAAMDSRAIKTLSMYAILISNKANELIKRAALNSRVDLAILKKEIYELGRVYIHKFSKASKRKENDKVNRR